MSEPLLMPEDLKVEVSPLAREFENLAAADEDTRRNFLDTAKKAFDRYSSARKEYETIWEVADYMYKAGQNRTIAAVEAEKGANIPEQDREEANTGSTMFFRLTRQNVSSYMAVHLSREDTGRYIPIVNHNVFASEEEADTSAEAYNLLARWTGKRDRYNFKTADFASRVFKQGSAAEMIFWKHRLGTRTTMQPVYEENEEGNMVITGANPVTEEYIVESYPTVDPFPIWNLYADVDLPISQQNCVMLVDVVSYSDLVEMVRSGEYDGDVLFDKDTGLGTTHVWNGLIGGEHIQDEKLSAGMETGNTPVQTGMFLRWNIFHRVPVDESGKWDQSKAPMLYWGVAIGNSLDRCLFVKLERNPDPDDEIPVNIVHCIEGDSDKLYGLAPAQIVRSNYSVECTLKNQAIDNNTLRNRTPLTVKEGSTTEKDFTFKKNKVWFVEDHDAVRQMQIADTTQQSIGLLQYIQEDTRFALSADDPTVGQALGGRTSATEAASVISSARQPVIHTVRYIMEQREYWRLRKYKSYWDAFGDSEAVIQITDDDGVLKKIKPGRLHGEFDIQIDVVDEFEDSALRQQALNEMMQVIGSSPTFLERINVAEFLRQMFDARRLNSTRLVLDHDDRDARALAEQENRRMEQGEYVRPEQGQNHKAHNIVHKQRRVRLKGIEQSHPEYAAESHLLDQHIAETDMLQTQALSAQTAPLPGGTRNETEGEAQGNQLAALQGAL